MKNLNNFLRPLLLCASVTVFVAVTQYLFDGKIDQKILDHVAAISVVAYFIGLHYGRREHKNTKPGVDQL